MSLIVKYLRLMMLVFQQELGWSVRGCWAGPKKLMDCVGGCQIVYGGIGSLHVDLQAPMETPLCKNKEGKGSEEGKGSARAWPVAAPMPKSDSFPERRERC